MAFPVNFHIASTSHLPRPWGHMHLGQNHRQLAGKCRRKCLESPVRVQWRSPPLWESNHSRLAGSRRFLVSCHSCSDEGGGHRAPVQILVSHVQIVPNTWQMGKVCVSKCLLHFNAETTHFWNRKLSFPCDCLTWPHHPEVIFSKQSQALHLAVNNVLPHGVFPVLIFFLISYSPLLQIISPLRL